MRNSVSLSSLTYEDLGFAGLKCKENAGGNELE